MRGKKVKVYRIECEGCPPKYHRLSSKRALKALRELHKQGKRAMLYVVNNRAEQREALAIINQ